MNENKLKRLNQYRTILQKEPQLFEISEMVYKDMVHLSDVQAGITSYVIAPVMYRFVSWVLNEAVKSGKKRLYFLWWLIHFMLMKAGGMVGNHGILRWL